MSEPNIPSFLKPLWARLALVLFLGGWTVVEIMLGQSPIWTAVFILATLYCVWEFLWKPYKAGGRLQ